MAKDSLRGRPASSSLLIELKKEAHMGLDKGKVGLQAGLFAEILDLSDAPGLLWIEAVGDGLDLGIEYSCPELGASASEDRLRR